MDLSLIIPAYNEERRIRRVLDLYTAFLGKKYDFELIVVSEGNDNTASIVKAMMVNIPGIKILEFTKRQGKGGAIIHGIKESRSEIIGFVDADESVSPSDFDKLIHSINGIDCAIASRRAKGARISARQPWKRRISSRVFNVFVNLLFGLGIKDTQCGAKVFKKSVIYPMLPIMKTRGFEFDVELLWRLKKAGFTIKEVPIVWKHESGSTFSLKYSMMMFLNLLKLRFSL
ncbi:MAG TPA: dolichyl-phosphate beta-glucosyltransferase [Candidatus Methanoperedens sp.]